MAVLLAGPVRSPRLLDRREIGLSDPAVPQSRQPYHAGFGTAQTSSTKVKRLSEVVARFTLRSVGELVAEYRSAGHVLRGVGVVVGSDVDPDDIANPHIRAHASEGRLFRDVVEDAARRNGLASTTVLERTVYATAAEALGRTDTEIQRAVGELGRTPRGRWRAEEKTAAAAAWLVLAGRKGKSGSVRR